MLGRCLRPGCRHPDPVLYPPRGLLESDGRALVLSIFMLVGNFGRNRSGLWPKHSPTPAAAHSERDSVLESGSSLQATRPQARAFTHTP
jgi:hypothetical protein